MHDIGLADRIRAKDVQVQEVAGWMLRGGDLDPEGALLHHTAGGILGVNPSFNTCLHGRPQDNIPGPLCQVLQGRHPTNPLLDPAIVIAAGKANHGGAGIWRGVSGNRKFHGLEVEHTGTGPVHPDRLEIAARIIAAMLEAPGSSRSADMYADHANYATPLGRKIDFFSHAPGTRTTFRHKVAFWIGRTVSGPNPQPTKPTEDDDMYIIEVLDAPGHDPILIGGGPPARLSNEERDAYRSMKDEAADDRRVVPKIKLSQRATMLVVHSEAKRFGTVADWS
jgi:hypothetical protein